MSCFIANLTFGYTQEAGTRVGIRRHPCAGDKQRVRTAGLVGKVQSPYYLCDLAPSHLFSHMAHRPSPSR